MQRIVKQNNRLSEEISRLQEDQLTQMSDYEEKILKVQTALQQKQQELQLVGQQLRMQLAKKSINKLSEVIGIKSVLTAMNLETDSEEEESAPVATEKES
jgi:adenylyl- and sulfurtransferase ThiI